MHLTSTNGRIYILKAISKATLNKTLKHFKYGTHMGTEFPQNSTKARYGINRRSNRALQILEHHIDLK